MNSRRRSPFTWRVHSRTSSPAATRNARTASQAGVSLPSKSTFIWRPVYPIHPSSWGGPGDVEKQCDLLLDPLSEIIVGHDRLARRAAEGTAEGSVRQDPLQTGREIGGTARVEEQAVALRGEQRAVTLTVRDDAGQPAAH